MSKNLRVDTELKSPREAINVSVVVDEDRLQSFQREAILHGFQPKVPGKWSKADKKEAVRFMMRIWFSHFLNSQQALENL